MPFPFMAAMGAAQVVGGLFTAGAARKEKRYAQREQKRAQLKADQRLFKMDQNITDLGEMRDADQQRLTDIYNPIEQQLGATVAAGVDIEGKATQASEEFGTQFDVSMDAARRQQQRQGVKAGSSGAAALEEDAAFARAKGAAGESNTARRAADDTDFARKLAFSQQGQSIRQGITNSYQGEFGMQGQIRGQYLNQAAGAKADANAAGQQITQGFASAAQGAMQGYGDPYGRNTLMTSDQRTSFDTANPTAKNETLMDIIKPKQPGVN